MTIETRECFKVNTKRFGIIEVQIEGHDDNTWTAKVQKPAKVKQSLYESVLSSMSWTEANGTETTNDYAIRHVRDYLGQELA